MIISTEFQPSKEVEFGRRGCRHDLSLDPRPEGPAPFAILGVPFDRLTLTEALERIEGMIRSGRPHYVATANVDFLFQASRDLDLRRILLEAHLVLCDGTPLVWASRWLGHPLPERVAGSDLVPLLIARAAASGNRVFFLGGSEETTGQAVRRLQIRHPNLAIAGHYSPPYAPLREMDHEEIRRRVQAARPDLLFVSFGCPKQEKWMAMHYQTLGVPVALGVGGTIDFLAGRLPRAPKWMQHMGIEWLFRMIQEPRRLGWRYTRDFWFFGGLLAATSVVALRRTMQPLFKTSPWRALLHSAPDQAAARTRLNASPGLAVSFGANTRGKRTLLWKGELTAANAECVWRQVQSLLKNEASPEAGWTMDLSRVPSIDGTGLSLLVRVRNQLWLPGVQIRFIGIQPAVQTVFRGSHLEGYLVPSA